MRKELVIFAMALLSVFAAETQISFSPSAVRLYEGSWAEFDGMNLSVVTIGESAVAVYLPMECGGSEFFSIGQVWESNCNFRLEVEDISFVDSGSPDNWADIRIFDTEEKIVGGADEFSVGTGTFEVVNLTQEEIRFQSAAVNLFAVRLGNSSDVSVGEEKYRISYTAYNSTYLRAHLLVSREMSLTVFHTVGETEPSYDGYTGYKHKCETVNVSEDSYVDVHFALEPINDGYLRYIMYSYDCPELRDKRQYLSSGCSNELCDGGKWCHIGTSSGGFGKTETLLLGAGEHLICTWPSSIGGLYWNASIEVVGITPLSQVPEPERFSGYVHKCVEIDVADHSMVGVEFNFESHNDSYLRYFMFSYDCPEIRDQKKYVSSGCVDEPCVGGRWCHLETERDRVVKTMEIEFEPGEHQICAWPSSPRGYEWDIGINVAWMNPVEWVATYSGLDYTTIIDATEYNGFLDLLFHCATDSPPIITGITVERASGDVEYCSESISEANPFMPQQTGDTGVSCDNVEFIAGELLNVVLFTANDSKEFTIVTRGPGQLEPVNVTGTPLGESTADLLNVCLQKSEDECASVGGCYWTEHCGCLYEGYECAEPLEQGEVIMNCPVGCICHPDGRIDCPLPTVGPEIGSMLICPDGCTLNNRCVGSGTRAEIDNQGKYCDIDGNWKIQRPKFEPCQNNYECTTNTCASGQCYDVVEEVQQTRGLVERLLRFIAMIFGIDLA